MYIIRTTTGTEQRLKNKIDTKRKVPLLLRQCNCNPHIPTEQPPGPSLLCLPFAGEAHSVGLRCFSLLNAHILGINPLSHIYKYSIIKYSHCVLH